MKHTKNMKDYVMTGFVIAVCLLSLGCKDGKEKLNYFHRVDPVETVIAAFAGSSAQFSTTQTKPYGNEIVIDFPYYFPEGSETPIDLSEVKVAITFNEGIEVLDEMPELVNLASPYSIRIRNADGAEELVTLTADVHESDEAPFEIKKGVNVASWLSTPKYDGELRSAFFQERDVKLLSELGFDHVRLAIDEVVLWDEQGALIRPYGFDLLHQAMEWCMKYNMRVLIDMHITRNHRFTNTENALFTDPGEPAKFVKLWEDLSDELAQYPNSMVAYELLNEPVSANPENWNRVAAMAIDAIRAREPNRTIVVGVCTSTNTVKYDALKLPNNHKILLTYHYYGPFLLTAYGLQSTTGGRTDIPINYPGQLVPSEWIDQLPTNWQSTGLRHYDKSTLQTSIMKGLNTARRLGVPVFVGEFGTLKTTPEPSRSNWYRDVVTIFQEEGLPYTSFDYKGAGYSIIDEDMDILYPTLVDILVGSVDK